MAELSKAAHERLTSQKIIEIGRTMRVLIRAAGLVGVFYCIYLSVDAIAGRDTNLFTSIAVHIGADLRFVFSLALAGSAAAWGAVERWLRKRKVGQLQGRIRELETAIDPRRSTSGLTPSGGTNPQDKWR